MIERITSYGHPNVTGKHKTTLEVTKEKELSLRGDCIIGVGAEKGLMDLNERFKDLAMRVDAKMEVTLMAEDIKETITGWGHPDLTFTHPTDIVIRKSDFICSRTLMIKADKSSKELNRKLIEKLKNPNTRLETIIKIKTPL